MPSPTFATVPPISSALKAIDLAHSSDPNTTTFHGVVLPAELHYAQRSSHYLDKHSPDASETLRLAVRAQHLRRWEIPRSSYPQTKAGYFAWRTYLKKRQAELAASICVEAGLPEEDAQRVAALVRKEALKSDKETQALEDVACLVFLEGEFEAFRSGKEEDMVIGVLRKTWGKMGVRGRELALEMKKDMGDGERKLLEKALGG